MPPNAASGSLSRHRSISTDHPLDTPQGSPITTPNTRKRQRIDYAQLYNSRGTTPTPVIPSPQQSPRRQAPLAQIVAPRPPRIRPPQATRTSRLTPLFDPRGRSPISHLRQNVIEVVDADEKVSKITKHKW